MSKVVKIKIVMPGIWASCGHYGQLYLGSQLNRDSIEKFPLGKVTISYRYKKGRRKLITGRIDAL